MDESKWKEMESKYYMHVANRYPMVLERGKGTKVWDTAGNEYLDFTSGWAVNNVGHSNQDVASAIAFQGWGDARTPRAQEGAAIAPHHPVAGPGIAAVDLIDRPADKQPVIRARGLAGRFQLVRRHQRMQRDRPLARGGRGPHGGDEFLRCLDVLADRRLGFEMARPVRDLVAGQAAQNFAQAVRCRKSD